LILAPTDKLSMEKKAVVAALPHEIAAKELRALDALK
jgi:hypothetical protein